MTVDELTTAPARIVQPSGVLSAQYRWITIGMCALIFLSAFEALAVTTIMPTVSRDLGGGSLYAFAFAGPLAIGVVGMVAAGNWADRGSPRAALYASVVLFVAGLLVAGTAQTMWVFVLGRLIHGLGGGALTVALYVIVARVYPPALHPSIFAGFSAAWVVPSLVGPFIAGLVAEHADWRWVFLGVVALVALAVAMVVPAMRSLARDRDSQPRVPRRIRQICWAALAAVAVLALNLSAQADGPLFWAVPIVSAVIAVVALRPLMPPTIFRAGRGLPSVVLLRGLLFGAFFGAEVYLPYVLSQEYGLSASIAGLALSAAGVSWAAASWLQSRFTDALTNLRNLRIGVGLVGIAIVAALATSLFALPPSVVIVGWAFAGAGMGLAYPRLSVMTLELSSTENQGFNSSALSISDSIGAAVALGVTAMVFTALLPAGGTWPFVGTFVVTAIICLFAYFISGRLVAARNPVAS